MIKKTYIDFKVDQLIDDYLDQENSKILENLESLILINEGIVGDISTFINSSKQNTENAIITLCVKVYIKISKVFDSALKLADKIFKVLLWICQKIQKFKQKHPILFKIVIISILALLILIISTTNANAADVKINLNKDYGISKDQLNLYLGYLHEYPLADGIKNAKGEAMLIDLKDGIINGPWSKDQIGDVIKICHETIRTGFENLQNKGDDHSILINLFTELVKSGEKLVGFTIQTLKSSSYSSETINIISTK